MYELLQELWPLLLAVSSSLAAIAATVHLLLFKRETRAAIAWVGLVWLAPLVGSLLYLCFGINRIRRRGQLLRLPQSRPLDSIDPRLDDVLPPDVVEHNANLTGLARLTAELTNQPLLFGNRVEALVGGDDAFPAMLAAIDAAKCSISLCSYIFDNDRAGQQFADALCRAKQRGVRVRVIIDDVGARYTRPTMIRKLEQAGVSVLAFLPTRVPRMFHYANLRNHRKLLVVDSALGFTGGINIREGNMLSWQPRSPVQDIHFRIEGPVVAHMQETFSVDWEFSGGDPLPRHECFAECCVAGDVWARGISDGPDEDFEKFHLTVLGAIAAASKSIHIVTPYFLPEAPVITALNVADMRGVDVHIIIPQRSNIPPVQWASIACVEELLERGCQVWLTPPPFDHSKLLVVDRVWSHIGSANWDSRSFRLNFEFNMECYDMPLGERLASIAEAKMHAGRELTLEEVRGRPLAVKLRDGVSRLFSPYM